MNELTVIEKNNERVLLTSQIAESYGTTPKVISYNFNSNKQRYVEGKHYYCLENEEKREFCNRLEIQDGAKASKLYLWTEKGALLHAKSLGTDKAWEVYECLVDSYFQKETRKSMSELEMLAKVVNEAIKLEKRVDLLESNQKQATQKIDKAIDVFSSPTESAWHDGIIKQFKKICYNNDLNYRTELNNLYAELETQLGCDLAIRQRNKEKRLKLAGCTVKQIKDNTTKIMLIEDDDSLRLAFENIFRKFQVRYI
jgi:hypothetical protein